MTAIVYRDGVMAADNAAWTGNSSRVSVIADYNNKITRLYDGSILGCAGRTSDCRRVISWYENGCIPGERPQLLEADNFSAIRVKGGLVWKIEWDCRPFPVAFDYVVIGAPVEFLHGALAAGASAEDAVRLAIEFTDGAAGEVQVEEV